MNDNPAILYSIAITGTIFMLWVGLSITPHKTQPVKLYREYYKPRDAILILYGTDKEQKQAEARFVREEF